MIVLVGFVVVYVVSFCAQINSWRLNVYLSNETQTCMTEGIKAKCVHRRNRERSGKKREKKAQKYFMTALLHN